MYYEINVSLNGRHYFATNARSITDSETAIRLSMDIKSRFPAKEGFKVTITYYPGHGYSADITNSEALVLIDTIEALSNK